MAFRVYKTWLQTPFGAALFLPFFTIASDGCLVNTRSGEYLLPQKAIKKEQP